MRYGMLIDLRKCVGCGACTVACRGENGTPAGISYNQVKKYEVGTYPSVTLKAIPMRCMHCQNAPCVAACPSGASYLDETGTVCIDANRCMGCRACMVSCPYEARQFLFDIKPYYEGQNPTPFELQKQHNFQKGTVVKCTGCKKRVAKGLEPACVKTCITGARIFGDLDDPNSEISLKISETGAQPFRAELGTQPTVYYITG